MAEEEDILKDRKSFIVYREWYEDIKELDNESLGQLVKDIFEFDLNGVVPNYKDKSLKILFNHFRNAYTRNADKYIKKTKANRENGKKGGRPSSKVSSEDNFEKTDEDLEVKKNLINDFNLPQNLITHSLEEIKDYSRKRGFNI